MYPSKPPSYCRGRSLCKKNYKICNERHLFRVLRQVVCATQYRNIFSVDFAERILVQAVLCNSNEIWREDGGVRGYCAYQILVWQPAGSRARREGLGRLHREYDSAGVERYTGKCSESYLTHELRSVKVIKTSSKTKPFPTGWLLILFL